MPGQAPAGGASQGSTSDVSEAIAVDLTQLESEIKRIIIDSLMLEDVTVEEIDTDGALFDTGLGLDSIDALEIAIALENSYGVTVEDDPEKNQELFASVRNLARFVNENRTV
jgi:acyl carrier protein